MAEAPATRALYWVNGSIPSWRALLALHEKRLPFASRRLRVMVRERETRSPEHLAHNPRGTAPTLVEADGVVVVESLAILLYLDRVYPEVALMPPASDTLATAAALSRLHASECLRAAYRPLEALFRPLASLDASARAAACAAPAAVARELALWEADAAAHPFIAGPALTLADCAFYPALAYQLRRGLVLGERFPHLAAYAAMMAAREAAVRAHPEGWEGDRGRDLFARAARLAAGDARDRGDPG